MKSNILIQVKATQNTLCLYAIKMFVLKQFVCRWTQSTVCQQPTEYSVTSFVSILNCISTLLIRLHLPWCIFLSPILLTVVLHSAQESHESGKPQKCQDTVMREWCSVCDRHEAFREGLWVLEGKMEYWSGKKKFLRIQILF